jgi:hypothetical protein
MRIIGGNDYYDSALAYGRDDDIVFVRNGEVVKYTDCPLHYYMDPLISQPRGRYLDGSTNTFTHNKNGQIETWDCIAISVYVAGKRYACVRAVNGLTRLHFWSKEKFTDWLAQYKQRGWNGSKWDDAPIKGLNLLFDPTVTKKQEDWLIDNRVAIAVTETRYSRNKYSVDPRDVWQINNGKEFSLRSVEFQKVMDPFTCMQELSMWVGNWPRHPNPMVTITDPVIKAQKHGFDKWSFRRHKDDAK